MILSSLSTLYGTAASARRAWYARDPQRRRRLSRPVVSIGNVRAGGAGKTPIVAHVARLLVAAGQRPAILTRGYGRSRSCDGVTVISSGNGAVADVAIAGDEPLMLARALPGVPVLVGADRYLSGLVAEQQFGVTVHLLDDGFQHVQLERTTDIVLVDEEDLQDRPLPGGRLREPVASAASADALLVTASYGAAADRIARSIGVATVFRVTRALGAPRSIPSGDSVVVPPGARVFAVAAIARPDRFFADLTATGWDLVGSLAFRDHHMFTRRDIVRITAAARSAAAAIVLTTEKDAVRFEGHDLAGLPIAAVPLTATVEPAADFRTWLLSRS